MLRKIALRHHGAANDTSDHEGFGGYPAESSDEGYLSVESRGDRPKEVVRTSSEPQRTLLSHGDYHRRASHTDSLFPGADGQSVSNLRDEPHDPLGLHLVCDNSNPSIDVIFVHGLGGTARKTWSWDRNVDNFWPVWLTEENDSKSYRIFTFGYNSNFKGPSTNLNIIDFAKDLLFHTLTFSDGLRSDGLPIGGRPLVFVAHSMGGLVVKKAYSLGKNDLKYASIISRVHGIIFLATPHRGAQYAKMLNNILSAAPLGAPPKAYITDLEAHSTALQDINEQFRTVCGELALVSFYETMTTSFGISKLLIVEKESGVLGYPQEMSSPLSADHYTICKFKNRQDGNYIGVKNVLKLWASKTCPAGRNFEIERPISNYNLTKKIESILGVRDPAEDELTTYRKRAMDGTCQWITQKEDFMQWSIGSLEPHSTKTFWLIGLPATGKTTLASVVADHLQSTGRSCQYHFFSSSHQAKRTAAYCLRSIASQLAHVNEEFRELLFTLHEESGLAFTTQNQNFNVIWEKIFQGIIFKMMFPEPLFWVLDAVDEVDSQSLMISHFMKIESLTPIRLFITSRPMKIPSTSASYGSSVTTYFLSQNDTLDDIRVYVHDVVRDALPSDEQIQEDIIDQILAKASGSFLWVKLALETLQSNWHTQDDIRKALTEVPKGMEALYKKMIEKITSQSERLQFMAKRILTWATCCCRPLSVAELQVFLEPDFTGFVKLEDTVVQICGHFISVNNSMISLIHATARDFLLNHREGSLAFINSREGHEHIATVCLKHLSNDIWRHVFKEVEKLPATGHQKSRNNRLLLAERGHPALGYSTCYWAYHVSKSPLDSANLFSSLKIFFARFFLSWVEAIALSSNLRYLIRSAQYLKVYTKRSSGKSNLKTLDPPLSLKAPPEDDVLMIQLWAIDLIRIVGKFGSNLVQSPSSIYRLVPPFCLRDSMIGRTYGNANNKMVSVTGLVSTGWNDCLASVSVDEGETAPRVVATDGYFLTLTCASGTIFVWYAETCGLARKLHHNEYVSLIALNKSGSLVATAGARSYRIWDISAGRELYCLPKTQEALTMAMSFGRSRSELVVGLDNCSVTCYDLGIPSEKWCFEAQPLQYDMQGCPRLMAFSPDLRKVAMAWRGKPPLVWDMTITQDQNPLHCRMRGSTDAICAPGSIQWQANGRSILILCQSTRIVEWHLYDEEQTDFDHIGASKMSVSEDGNFLLSTNNVGTMSVWTFPRLSLIYRLLNEHEFIRSLTFSPDGQRFYDTRGSMCNVWEPDALIRPDEQDLEDHSSVGESFTGSEPTISHDESSQSQVTALASDSTDRYYCCGREDGTVTIHEAIEGNKIRKEYSHASTSSVIILAWSVSGKYMVSGDDSGRILAKRLEAKGAGKWGVFPVFEFRSHEPVQQFLFKSNEKLLLISTQSSDRVWDLKVKKEVCLRNWGQPKGRRWIDHSLSSELLIWIDPVEIHVYNWRNLERVDTVQTSPTIPSSPFKPQSGIESVLPVHRQEDVVQWATLTKDKRYIAYEILPKTGHGSTGPSGSLHLEFISTSDLRMRRPRSLTIDCMADLAGQVKRLIGNYDDRVVFLDHDFWLCTWEIDTDVNNVTRHFFLPKDWLNTGTLQMTLLNGHGTLFCPKRGEVAIIRNGMRF